MPPPCRDNRRERAGDRRLVIPAEAVAELDVIGQEEGVDHGDADVSAGDALGVEAADFFGRIDGGRSGVPSHGGGRGPADDVRQRGGDRLERWAGDALDEGVEGRGREDRGGREFQTHMSEYQVTPTVRACPRRFA
jgi:hypothetical protein